MQKELLRIKDFAERFPDTEIWVISRNGIQAKLYWERIKANIETINIEPYIFTANLRTIDGLNPKNAVILLCGRWYENPIANSEAWKYYLKNARYTLPIGEIPDPKIL